MMIAEHVLVSVKKYEEVILLNVLAKICDPCKYVQNSIIKFYITNYLESINSFRNMSATSNGPLKIHAISLINSTENPLRLSSSM